jgi:hypothetical protein
VNLKGKPININIRPIQVYAPTTESTDQDLDKFYNGVEIATKRVLTQESTANLTKFQSYLESLETSTPRFDMRQ